jgi:lipopolysaccharide export system protein LptC
MLAPATDPTAPDETAASQANVSPARARAFGNAQRHSRRVRLLKFTLPLAAALIAVAFPLYSYLMAPVSIAVDADSSALTDGKLVMANPKLQGLTKQNMPYSMVAKRAVQDIAKQGLIELEGIDATLPLNADVSAKVEAARGLYNRDSNTLDLSQDITVTTSDGMVAKFKSAFLDMGKGIMKTDDPVEITRDGSRIASDTMNVENNGKTLIFEKRVRVNIDPASLKTAENANGAAHAAQ